MKPPWITVVVCTTQLYSKCKAVTFLTFHSDGVGDRSLNLPSCSQLACPSMNRVWTSELLSQCDGTGRCGSDLVIVDVLQLFPCLIHPAQTNSFICHWPLTVVICVQEAVESHMTVFLHLSLTGGSRDYRRKLHHHITSDLAYSRHLHLNTAMWGTTIR